MSALHDLYRPRDFDEVMGQDEALKALKRLIADKGSQAFLFAGPAGVGKTTLARIVAKKCGCNQLVEVDAASRTGVDDMRNLQQLAQFRPLTGGNKAFIIDEAHRLSGNAWDSLLKIIEEPPAFVYFFLCTTQLGKVPDTIQSRCAKLILKPVKDADLSALCAWVAREEGLKLDLSVLDLIVKEAKGSARKALVYLATVGHMTDKKQAASILHSALESDVTLEFCRFVVSGGSWMKAMTIVNKLTSESPESVRIVTCNYLAAVLKSAKDDRKAVDGLRRLEAFSVPYNQSEGLAPLILSLGRVLYGD